MGMCLVAYINDILVLAKSKEKALNHTEGSYGLSVGMPGLSSQQREISVLILSQTLEFLDLTINTTNMEFQLLLHKMNTIWTEYC